MVSVETTLTIENVPKHESQCVCVCVCVHDFWGGRPTLPVGVRVLAPTGALCPRTPTVARSVCVYVCVGVCAFHIHLQAPIGRSSQSHTVSCLPLRSLAVTFGGLHLCGALSPSLSFSLLFLVYVVVASALSGSCSRLRACAPVYPRRSWAQRTNAMENVRERKKWSCLKTPPTAAHHGPVHVCR